MYEWHKKEAPLLGLQGSGGGLGFLAGSAVGGGSGFSEGVVYAFSGNNTSVDESGNGTTISYNSKGYSTTRKKWSSYTHSFNLPGTTDSDSYVATPGFTPSSTGWSIEFWIYPTNWGGKYLMAASGVLSDSTGSVAINVQSSEFRFYRFFYNVNSIISENTNTYLNRWNFFQIYYDGSSTRFRINGTEKTSISGNINTPPNIIMFGNGGGGSTNGPAGQFPVTGFIQDIVVYNGVNRGAVSVPTNPFGIDPTTAAYDKNSSVTWSSFLSSNSGFDQPPSRGFDGDGFSTSDPNRARTNGDGDTITWLVSDGVQVDSYVKFYNQAGSPYTYNYTVTIDGVDYTSFGNAPTFQVNQSGILTRAIMQTTNVNGRAYLEGIEIDGTELQDA